MKIKIITAVTLAAIVSISGYLLISPEDSFAQEQNSMSSMSDMCQSMMNSIPQDVIMKTVSSQVAKINEKSDIILLVTDKINNPLDDAVVILHIEEGAPMESMKDMNMMDMMSGMFEAENIGDGKYLIKFTPENKGYYTMHTHVIPDGKSMMSMMNNHMDIGIIAV